MCVRVCGMVRCVCSMYSVCSVCMCMQSPWHVVHNTLVLSYWYEIIFKYTSLNKELILTQELNNIEGIL